MAKHKDDETKPAAMEVSPPGDARNVSAHGAENGDAPHHAVHLDSERTSRLRKRPTRY